MKNLIAGFAIALLIVCAVLLYLQRQAQEKLRAEDESLRQQIAQLKADNENLSNAAAQAKSSQSLPDEQFTELLKLRGEVGVLRRQTNELGKLRQENQQLQAAQGKAESQQSNADAQEQQRQAIMQRVSYAKQGVLAFIMFADDNQQQFPTNFAQASPYLMNNMEQIETNFDMVYQGSTTNIANPSGAIVFKEKQAWQMLDGKWLKTYGFADGHVETHTEANENFDHWESQHTALPPPNQ
jgi:prepilin-type processing-associated H-X9-DG protein